MGYQNGPATITVTRDGEPVVWIVDYVAKTVTVTLAGVTLGTWGNRTAAKTALDLIDVPAPKKGRKAA